MKVKEVMKKAMATEHDMSVEEARRLMIRNQISSLIFVEKGKIKGIVTEEDILENIKKDTMLSAIMHRKVFTIHPDEKIEEAARQMKEHKVSVLPVAKKKGLLGIVSSRDLVGVLGEGGDFIFE